MSYEQIIYTKEEGVATITLNRPRILNAFTPIMIDEWTRAIEAANGHFGGMDPGKQRFLLGLLTGLEKFQGLSYDRQQESEADHIGLFLMTFAGYDPDEAVRFWRRMQQAAANQPRPPEILSDHPSDARRVAQLQAWVPYAKAAKKQFDEGRIAPPAR